MEFSASTYLEAARSRFRLDPVISARWTPAEIARVSEAEIQRMSGYPAAILERAHARAEATRGPEFARSFSRMIYAFVQTELPNARPLADLSRVEVDSVITQLLRDAHEVEQEVGAVADVSAQATEEAVNDFPLLHINAQRYRAIRESAPDFTDDEVLRLVRTQSMPTRAVVSARKGMELLNVTVPELSRDAAFEVIVRDVSRGVLKTVDLYLARSKAETIGRHVVNQARAISTTLEMAHQSGKAVLLSLTDEEAQRLAVTHLASPVETAKWRISEYDRLVGEGMSVADAKQRILSATDPSYALPVNAEDWVGRMRGLHVADVVDLQGPTRHLPSTKVRELTTEARRRVAPFIREELTRVFGEDAVTDAIVNAHLDAFEDGASTFIHLSARAGAVAGVRDYRMLSSLERTDVDREVAKQTVELGAVFAGVGNPGALKTLPLGRFDAKRYAAFQASVTASFVQEGLQPPNADEVRKLVVSKNARHPEEAAKAFRKALIALRDEAPDLTEASARFLAIRHPEDCVALARKVLRASDSLQQQHGLSPESAQHVLARIVRPGAELPQDGLDPQHFPALQRELDRHRRAEQEARRIEAAAAQVLERSSQESPALTEVPFRSVDWLELVRTVGRERGHSRIARSNTLMPRINAIETLCDGLAQSLRPVVVEALVREFGREKLDEHPEWTDLYVAATARKLKALGRLSLVADGDGRGVSLEKLAGSQRSDMARVFVEQFVRMSKAMVPDGTSHPEDLPIQYQDDEILERIAAEFPGLPSSYCAILARDFVDPLAVVPRLKSSAEELHRETGMDQKNALVFAIRSPHLVEEELAPYRWLPDIQRRGRQDGHALRRDVPRGRRSTVVTLVDEAVETLRPLMRGLLVEEFGNAELPSHSELPEAYLVGIKEKFEALVASDLTAEGQGDGVSLLDMTPERRAMAAMVVARRYVRFSKRIGSGSVRDIRNVPIEFQDAGILDQLKAKMPGLRPSHYAAMVRSSPKDPSALIPDVVAAAETLHRNWEVGFYEAFDVVLRDENVVAALSRHASFSERQQEAFGLARRDEPLPPGPFSLPEPPPLPPLNEFQPADWLDVVRKAGRDFGDEYGNAEMKLQVGTTPVADEAMTTIRPVAKALSTVVYGRDAVRDEPNVSEQLVGAVGKKITALEFYSEEAQRQGLVVSLDDLPDAHRKKVVRAVASQLTEFAAALDLAPTQTPRDLPVELHDVGIVALMASEAPEMDPSQHVAVMKHNPANPVAAAREVVDNARSLHRAWGVTFEDALRFTVREPLVVAKAVAGEELDFQQRDLFDSEIGSRREPEGPGRDEDEGPDVGRADPPGRSPSDDGPTSAALDLPVDEAPVPKLASPSSPAGADAVGASRSRPPVADQMSPDPALTEERLDSEFAELPPHAQQGVDMDDESELDDLTDVASGFVAIGEGADDLSAGVDELDDLVDREPHIDVRDLPVGKRTVTRSGLSR